MYLMKVVLVERRNPGQLSMLPEIEALTRTLGYEVVEKISQVREPDPAYQIGRGKVKEIERAVKLHGAKRVVFANQLTPTQAFNLSKALGVEVLDKVQLILEIFAMRAGTPDAKLQVEYAKLKYELPRIRERIRSIVAVEQPGRMGGGEYEVQVHYDAIKRRLVSLRKKLATIEKRRELLRKRRKKLGFKLVTLAGYTNSGKSTLLNALTEGGAEVDDKYFATLAPRTRALKKSPKILLTDTVGFIEDMPPMVVEAFKATLEEIYLADVILLVLDGSDPVHEMMRKYKACMQFLENLDAKIVVALNKIDLLKSPEELEEKLKILNSAASTVVSISALKGENLDTLIETLRMNT